MDHRDGRAASHQPPADSLWTLGYSTFGDVKLPFALWSSDTTYPLHVFARADWFNADENAVIADDAKYTKLITGLAHYLYKDNPILLSYRNLVWPGLCHSGRHRHRRRQ